MWEKENMLNSYLKVRVEYILYFSWKLLPVRVCICFPYCSSPSPIQAWHISAANLTIRKYGRPVAEEK